MSVADKVGWPCMYAYRGEDHHRNPEQLAADGGFKPWKISSIKDARETLYKLVIERVLVREAWAWCLSKDRKNGYFISTGLDTTTAYDTYENFYRINIIRLQNRDSKMPGWEWLNCLDDALVYTDAPSLKGSTNIGVIITGQGGSRRQELLLMWVFPHLIQVQSEGKGHYKPLWDYIPSTSTLPR
jgi:hypothetical protein